ncbi:transcriptional repressor LexA [Bradyrhizobium yuanmingense]|uniref:transcriptional repressor LexA n=1 Tax=Bradyrhizobium yuanmingense TaxID=108015 RepID=UPI0023B8DCBF|nr:transcriptional repressor LexA [Bradyrhizobium yuanmingense]MDF0492749.1 transcriptional repressor LexA [Bradyrhizobium yuanmingense]
MSIDAELTPRQRQIFEFVEEHMAATGAPPTLEEICDRFSFKSPNAAREHLRLIEQKGYLQRAPRRARGIRIGREDSALGDLVRVPLLGRIVAGNPTEAVENIEARLPLPRALLGGARLFALRVGGRSMEGAGIFDGDIAILNGEVEVANGAIAAVLVGEETTLKRVFRSRDGVRLRAENPEFPDVVFDQSNAGALRVAGLLVGVLRLV